MYAIWPSAHQALARCPELPEWIEPSLLAIWVRNGPIEHLLARDFGAFEDDLDALDRLS